MKKAFITIIIFSLSNIGIGQAPISVSKVGKGNPIIFLPGFTSPGSVWEATIENLSISAESHTVSYAGFNGLAPIGTPWYPVIKQALLDYVNKEGLTNITLVGHSMGGNLATELAAELNEAIIGLIIVDALPCMREVMMPGVPASSIQYESPYNNQLISMSDEAFEQVAKTMAGNMTNQEEKKDLLASWSVEADRETYAYGYTDLLKLDLRPLLSKIEVNTLILGASFPTKEIAISTLESQYANLKDKNIKVIEDSKHFIMFDQPEWFYDQVNEYLNDNAQ
ncbi:MAG: alpha/beta hydrolase [Ekhidna sp.]